MDYLEKKMNPDETVARVRFKNACKKIRMKKMTTQPNFLKMSAVQEECSVDMNQDD